MVKTWPIIRHIRWAFNVIAYERHLSRCRSMGLGFAENKADMDYIRGIWKGIN